MILGAGYDTRAYRIEELNGNVPVFEVDRQETLAVKKKKIEDIFGSLPSNVVYVPIDFDSEKLGQRLNESGYNTSLKTLFIMEGLIMYIPAKAVDETLAFIAKNSAQGSWLLFDYCPNCVVDGTCEIGKNIKSYVKQAGEPLQFGIDEDKVEAFLRERILPNK